MNREILIDRLENQIEKMFDTLLKIEKEEQENPMRQLSKKHEILLWIVFSNQVLMKNCWNKKLKWLTLEEKCKYIKEVWKMTHEHYKNLYWHDTTNNININNNNND